MVPRPGTNFSAYFRSPIHVYHKDNEGALQSLENFDLSERILEAISRGERSLSTRLFSPGDLKRLKLIGLQTASEVKLVVEFPWDGRSFLAIVTKANDTQLRRRVLAMAVDRIRKTASLSRILTLKGLATCTVRENQYLAKGHPPYENFIDSLLAITDTSTHPGQLLFELFLESAADDANEETLIGVEERGLRTVFHGTSHAVMDSILHSGLDPNCRSSHLNEDYFGINYTTSLGYTKSKTTPPPTRYKLLVFLIIVNPADRSFFSSSSGAVTVQSNKLQLPLAEITL